jgi:predicted transcriptional regulator of viral defense system
MWAKTIASRVLRDFGEDRRRVISQWRIMISARRIAHAENAPLPNAKKSHAILRELVERGDVAAVKGVDGVYTVEAAYANLLDVSEEQIIQEANPWAVFGFLTAMMHNSLTDLLAKEIHVIDFKGGEHERRVPLGTTPDDWVDLALPATRRPTKVGETQVVWTDVQSRWDFGVMVGYSSGLPVYVTDVERTLLDALRMPDKCGGIAKVLQAWKAADRCDLDRLVAYTDRFDIQNLKQRVGFVLEKLGRSHPRLANWRDRLQRGGSVKLLASGPYSETYSTEWNLSLNVPSSVVAIIEQE